MRRLRNRSARRKGAVLILVALLLVPIVAMVAFAIDIGYVAMTRTELQRAADAAALAGAGALLDKDALKGAPNPADEKVVAAGYATAYGGLNAVGGVSLSVPAADIESGYVSNPSYPVVLGTPPANNPNAIKVTLRRDNVANGPIGMFFGGVLGKTQQNVSATAIAYYETGINGFKVTSGQPNAGILPFTMRVADWDAGFTSGSDNFTHNTSSETVSSGGDGIREVKLFPLDSGGNGGGGATPGNFGTVDIGSPGNSTADLARQIVYGANASDLSYFPNNTVQLNSSGYLMLNGDTGISAGMKDELASIKGQPRVLPLYESVSGNGNNAQFKIVKFVGITIVDVKLTGSDKYVTIQPAYAIEPSAIGGGTDGTTSSFVKRSLSLVE